MSNSKLCTYIDINHTHRTTRKYAISRITIHVAAGDLNFDGYSSTLRGRPCSWNYAVQSDGQIGLFVEECYRAWTTGSNTDPRGALNDHRAVTMEVSNKWGSNDGYKVTDAALDAVINLCEDICRRNGKTTLIWLGDVDKSENYSPKSHEMIMTIHKWYDDTSCPGQYLYSKQSHIAKTVTARLGGPNTITYPDGTVISAYNSATTGTIYKLPEELTDTSTLSPYVITTSHNTHSINYERLKDMGVSGAILEAGQFYDVIHTEKDIISYRNPNLKSQILEATNNELLYGYWHSVKARNTSEAHKEANALISLVRIWPPIIGVWLKLELVKPKSMNDSIIDVYRELLTNAGLHNQMGIYCNRSQLSKISWNKHKEHFALWLDDHVHSTFDLTDLDSPEFFIVDKSSNDKYYAIMREVSYVDSRSEPSILSTDIKLSVINYNMSTTDMFNMISKFTSSSDVILDNLDSVKREIVKFFIDKEFPASAGVGILANIYHDSNCRTDKLSNYQKGIPTSFGLCQWSGERGATMIKCVGSNWANNLTGQLTFLYLELSTGYKSLISSIQSAPNNETGATIVADAFVRQFKHIANVDDESIKRQNTARDFWSKIVPQLT